MPGGSQSPLLRRTGARLTEKDMMRGAVCGRVFSAAPHFRVAQPSHSDVLHKASESIGPDYPPAYPIVDGDMPMMP